MSVFAKGVKGSALPLWDTQDMHLTDGISSVRE